MAGLPDPLYSPEEYLARERAAEFKSEYLNGEIYAMAGASPAHAAITMNLGRILGNATQDSDCQVFSNDLRIATHSRCLFAYPDLTIVCGDLEFVDDRNDTATNPTLIAEVLSPSTEAYDRGKKFFYYRQIGDLQDYILVAQDAAWIDHYHRQANGEWTISTARGMDASLVLPSINVTLRLADVYDRVPLSADLSAEPRPPG